MDEVLTRPLFRDAYLQTVNKNTSDGILSVYKFQKGGEVFSEQEKFAYLAAPVISSLLQGTVSPGQSKLSALFGSIGQGISQIPPIGLKIKEVETKKTKPTTALAPLSDAEKSRLNLPIQNEYVGTYTDGVLSKYESSFDISKEKQTALKEGRLAKITKPDNALRELELDLNKFGSGDLPGVGPIAGYLPAFAISQAGKDLRTKLARFATGELREQSGQAVTATEYERFLETLGGGEVANEKTIRAAIVDIRKAFEKEKRTALEGLDSRTAKDLVDSGAISLYESPLALKASAGRLDTPKDADINTLNLENGVKLQKIGQNVYVYDPSLGRYVSQNKYNQLKGKK